MCANVLLCAKLTSRDAYLFHEKSHQCIPYFVIHIRKILVFLAAEHLFRKRSFFFAVQNNRQSELLLIECHVAPSYG